MIDILIGLVVVGVIAAVVWLAKHQPKNVADARTVANHVAADTAQALEELKTHFGEELAKVPGMVSDEIAQLRTSLAAALARAEKAEADFAAQAEAHRAALSQVAGRVTAAIQSSPELAG